MHVILYSYASSKSHPNVARYVATQTKRLTNLNQQKIVDLLGCFNSEWRSRAETAMTDRQKDAIDSVVANRHNVVHGRSVGISPIRIQSYYKDVLDVVALLEDLCLRHQD